MSEKVSMEEARKIALKNLEEAEERRKKAVEAEINNDPVEPKYDHTALLLKGIAIACVFSVVTILIPQAISKLDIFDKWFKSDEQKLFEYGGHGCMNVIGACHYLRNDCLTLVNTDDEDCTNKFKWCNGVESICMDFLSEDATYEQRKILIRQLELEYPELFTGVP